MQFRSIFRILGVLLMIFSGSMLPPILVAMIYHDGAFGSFLFTFVAAIPASTTFTH